MRTCGERFSVRQRKLCRRLFTRSGLIIARSETHLVIYVGSSAFQGALPEVLIRRTSRRQSPGRSAVFPQKLCGRSLSARLERCHNRVNRKLTSLSGGRRGFCKNNETGVRLAGYTRSISLKELSFKMGLPQKCFRMSR